MTRGRVVLIPFPFDDLTSQKVRPAVCLTDPVGPHRHVVLAFVTSREPTEPLASDIRLDPADPDFKETGLRTKSTVRTHRLLTVGAALIKRELGKLTPALQARVSQALRELFRL